MKRIRIVLGFGLLLAFGLILGSCTKNDSTTVTLIGTEYYIDSIYSVIPDSLQARFFAEFGSIPSGVIPPKIEGSYVMAPKQRVATNTSPWPLDVVEPNVYMRFSKQHNGIAAIELAEDTENLSDTVFICGSGNSFAVYFVEDKSFKLEFNNQSYTIRSKRGIIMKGTVTSEGFSDFRYASIIMDVEDSSGLIPPRGSYYVYKDGDGLARKEEW